MIRSFLSWCPTGRECCGKGECPDFDAACLEQRVGCCIQSAAGRQYIIDQPDPGCCSEPSRRTKGAADVFAPRATDESGLGGRVLSSCQRIGCAGNAERLANPMGDGIDVIEATMALSSWVEWNAHDQIWAFPRFDRDPSRQHDR